MFNPRDDKQVARLMRAVENSRQDLEPRRRMRMNRLKKVAGQDHAKRGTDHPWPMPYLAMWMMTVSRYVMPKAPKVWARTWVRDLRPEARSFSLDMDMLLEEISFGRTMRRIVVDAMLGVGVAKCGVEIRDGFGQRRGRPFVDAVDLDDLILDMRCKSWEQRQFCGNYYTVPLESIKESKEYKNTDDLQPDVREPYNEQGDEKAENIEVDPSDWYDSYYDEITLGDIHLPLANLIITFPKSDPNKIIRVAEYADNEEGPYSVLELGPTLPGSPLPMAPASLLTPIAEAGNHIWNKVIKKAKDAKGIVGVRLGGEADAERVNDANDGEFVPIDDPASMQKMDFNGPDQSLVALGMMMNDYASMFGQSYNTLSGASPNAETATQDKMLFASSNKIVSDQAADVMTFSKERIKHLSKYRWHDQTERYHVIKKGSLEFTRAWGPLEARRGQYPDYYIEIDLYSVTQRSPQERFAALSQIVDRYVMNGYPIMQQQGIGWDYAKFLTLCGQMNDLPELEEMLMFQEATQMELDSDPMRKPSSTERTYRRVNVPGAASQQKHETMAMSLMGAKSQPAEMATAMR